MAFDKHVPLPETAKTGDTAAPRFKDMEVGDSVFAPHEGSIMHCKNYMRAKTLEKRSAGAFRFVGRSVIEDGVIGVRVWRTS